MKNFDLDYIRGQFPALSLVVNGQRAAFFDGPGGTQVPQRVIDAMVKYLVECNANAGGSFLTSERSDQVISEARRAMADFLGSDPSEVAFGQNTTTLMFHLALALGREPGSRREIVITELDHEANRGPWLALEERGFTIRQVKLNPQSCTIDLEDFARQLSDQTLVAAFSYASNGVGTINNVSEMINLAHAAGAITVVDAVHYALHGPLDVKALDVDYLLCSAYKFFGPHLGILYGKHELLSKLPTYRLKVQSSAAPYRMETGTLNHEGIAGSAEAVEFIADLGKRFGNLAPGSPACSKPHWSERRSQIIAGMEAMEAYEQPLAAKLIAALSEMNKVTVYGPPAGHPRTSTVSFTIEGISAATVATRLGALGLFVWSGHFYALCLVEKLGLDQIGGLVRVGLSPYNTEAEIDRLIAAIAQIAD